MQYNALMIMVVRFVVVELIHPGSNSKFDMCIAFMTNYSFRGR
jgi:hypothetical protein